MDAINAHGAGLELGAPLSSAGGAPNVYELQVARGEADTGVTGPAGAVGEAHGGGSLTVTSDADAGLAEYRRCESAADLLCFRVANVVMIFETGIAAEDLERLETAVRAIGTEE